VTHERPPERPGKMRSTVTSIRVSIMDASVSPVSSVKTCSSFGGSNGRRT
jgi:hypothetical protein